MPTGMRECPKCNGMYCVSAPVTGDEPCPHCEIADLKEQLEGAKILDGNLVQQNADLKRRLEKAEAELAHEKEEHRQTAAWAKSNIEALERTRRKLDAALAEPASGEEKSDA